MRKLAKKLKCSRSRIKKLLNKYNISIRGPKEANKIVNKEKGRKPQQIVNCTYCGKSFKRRYSRIKQNNFCSWECYQKTRAGDYLHCDYCGEEIYVTQSRITSSEHHFCNMKCYQTWSKETGFFAKESNHSWQDIPKLTCPICGKQFRRTKAIADYNEVNYCSVECMGIDYQRRFSGSNSPTWTGGKKSYYGPNWHSQRRATRRRDKYTCQVCGVLEKDYHQQLSVHHKKPFRTFNNYKEANRLSNLSSLCENCHRFVHSNNYNGELIQN